jgi:hypothetical protein
MAQLIIKDLPYLDAVTGESAALALQGGLYVRAGGSAIASSGTGSWVTAWAIAQGPTTATYANTLAVTTLPASGQAFSFGLGVAVASARP